MVIARLATDTSSITVGVMATSQKNSSEELLANGVGSAGGDADIAERAVNQRVQVVLTQYQFDALVSFVFNIGVGAFGGSTLLRRLNGGEYDAVPAELMSGFIRAVHSNPASSGAVGPKASSSPKETTAISMCLPTTMSRRDRPPLSICLPNPITRKASGTTTQQTRLRSLAPTNLRCSRRRRLEPAHPRAKVALRNSECFDE